MTGRELIIYIMQNNLEDKEIFKDGSLVGFMSVGQACARFKVGVETVRLWYFSGLLKGIKLGDSLYFPIDATDPRKENHNERIQR